MIIIKNLKVYLMNSIYNNNKVHTIFLIKFIIIDIRRGSIDN